MVTPLDQQKVCSDLLAWGRYQAPPIQVSCMAIAFNLTCLASKPDSPALRHEVMKRIARLEEAVRNRERGIADL